MSDLIVYRLQLAKYHWVSSMTKIYSGCLKKAESFKRWLSRDTEYEWNEPIFHPLSYCYSHHFQRLQIIYFSWKWSIKVVVLQDTVSVDGTMFLSFEAVCYKSIKFSLCGHRTPSTFHFKGAYESVHNFVVNSENSLKYAYKYFIFSIFPISVTNEPLREL